MAAAAEHVEDEIQNQEVPEPTLRDQLLDARDESVARQTDRPVEEIREERQRDPSGRFTKTDRQNDRERADAGGNQGKSGGRVTDRPGSAAAGSVVRPATDGSNSGNAAAPAANGGNASPGVAPQPVEAPQSWAAHEKALWQSIPEAARAVITRREAEAHQVLTRHDQVRQVGNEFMKAANEFAPLIQARGNNPAALWREYLGILHRLESSDPVSRTQLFREIGQRMGIDIQGQSPSPQQQPQLPVHPAIAQMSQEWNAFKHQQAQEQQRQAQAAREREEAEMQQTASEIESFRSNPANKHFEAVSSLMASLLRGEHAQTLEEAYALAVKAHPEVSQAIAAELQAAQQAEEKKRQVAALAKRKSGSVRGGYGGAIEQSGSRGSVREDLQAAFEAARGRI